MYFFPISILIHFGIDFEPVSDSKNCLKNYIFRKNGGSKATSDAPLLWSCFWRGFWSPQSSIFKPPEGFFGHMLQNMREAFQVEELTLMIRATRGRSMDGCMDGSMDGWMDGWMDGSMDGWMDG